MKSVAGRFFLGLAVLLWGQAMARGAIQTYEFGGTISGAVDYSGLGYVPSSIQPESSRFVGTLSFDNAVLPASTDASGAYYRGTALDLSVSITIDGTYTYALATPSSDDEIDIIGSDFELFKRGPTVYTNFAPNPPFSHLDFEGTTQSQVLSDAIVGVGSPYDANGISDAQTTGAAYYYIELTVSSIQAVPEPGALCILGVGCLGLRTRRR